MGRKISEFKKIVKEIVEDKDRASQMQNFQLLQNHIFTQQIDYINSPFFKKDSIFIKEYPMKKAHPGFKAVQKKIESEDYGKKAAGAILANATRKASPKAKKANPKLKKVKS